MAFGKFVSKNFKLSDSTMQHGKWKHVFKQFTNHGNFAFFYGMYLFLYEISLFRDVISFAHPFLIAWACFLVIYDAFALKIWKKIPARKTLFFFLLSAMLTAWINLETGAVGNAKAWCMTAIPLLAFYPICILGSANEKKKTLIKAMLGAELVFFLSSLTAIAMYLARISNTVEFMGKTIVVGYRYYLPGDPSSGILLYGVNEDTNHAAIYALVFAALSLFVIFTCARGLFSKKWIDIIVIVFSCLNFLIQICYFPLANSRGAWLALIFSCAIVAAFFFYTKFVLKGRSFSIAKTMCATLCTVALICGGLICVRTAISEISVTMHSSMSVAQDYTTLTADASGALNVIADIKKYSDISMNVNSTENFESRDVFYKSDSYIGAGRMWIWKDSLRLFLKKPVMGDGPGNNAYYANKYDVAVNSLGLGKAVHNSWLDLLLNYGMVGFALMMIFLILCVKNILSKIVNHGIILEFSYFLVMFCVLLVAIGSMFLSCIFINTTAMSFILFVMMGYLVSTDEYVVRT